MAKLSKKQLIEALKEMTIKEVMELVHGMKEEFGIDPTAVTIDSKASKNEDTVEKTEFNVVLTSIGQSKVAVIKAVKASTGLGLMDAKKLIETAPVVIKEKLSKAEADELVKLLKEAGAEVKLD